MSPAASRTTRRRRYRSASPAIRLGGPLPEKSTSVVDANVIVSLLLGNERAHSQRARVFFEPVGEGSASAFIPSAVLAECVRVRPDACVRDRARGCRQQAARIARLSRVLTESAAVYQALTLYRDRKVDFVDALVAAIARERGWHVFSFDRDPKRLVK